MRKQEQESAGDASSPSPPFAQRKIAPSALEAAKYVSAAEKQEMIEKVQSSKFKVKSCQLPVAST